MTAISGLLFSDCTGLQSVQIPDGVTYIGWGAFSGCSSLRSLTIPEGVRDIQGMTFSGCRALQSVNSPEKVTDIGIEAFSGCTRGQVVTFLWRAAGKPEPESAANPFADVRTGEYYETPVIWAVENGVTTGTAADRFSPAATCTRAQIVTFLYRSAGQA